eukprot:GHVU01111283.1.p1 GENE.GHVU01111283.1~~GHVU01111283.1.p1  ORF type:complete len:728 (-),score=147.60 GHVU01111283.1:484-2667(-)
MNFIKEKLLPLVSVPSFLSTVTSRPDVHEVEPHLFLVPYPDPECAPNITRFFETNYATKYLVLCMSERGYDASVVFPTGTVLDMNFRGMPYPPMEALFEMFATVEAWLAPNPDAALVVHCYRALTRSVVFMGCFLAWRGHVPDAATGAHYVCRKIHTSIDRMLLPSQFRCFEYFDAIRSQKRLVVKPVRLTSLLFSGCLATDELDKEEEEEGAGGLADASRGPRAEDRRYYVDIIEQGVKVLTTDDSESPDQPLPEGDVLQVMFASRDDSSSRRLAPWSGESPMTVRLSTSLVLKGDVVIRLRYTLPGGDRSLFRVAFHTSFIDAPSHTFAHAEMDGAYELRDGALLQLVVDSARTAAASRAAAGTTADDRGGAEAHRPLHEAGGAENSHPLAQTHHHDDHHRNPEEEADDEPVELLEKESRIVTKCMQPRRPIHQGEALRYLSDEHESFRPTPASSGGDEGSCVSTQRVSDSCVVYDLSTPPDTQRPSEPSTEDGGGVPLLKPWGAAGAATEMAEVPAGAGAGAAAASSSPHSKRGPHGAPLRSAAGGGDQYSLESENLRPNFPRNSPPVQQQQHAREVKDEEVPLLQPYSQQSLAGGGSVPQPLQPGGGGLGYAAAPPPGTAAHSRGGDGPSNVPTRVSESQRHHMMHTAVPGALTDDNPESAAAAPGPPSASTDYYESVHDTSSSAHRQQQQRDGGREDDGLPPQLVPFSSVQNNDHHRELQQQ